MPGNQIDPRLYWLSRAMHRMFGEVDPDGEIIGLVLGWRTADGEFMNYTLTVGDPEISRQIVTDEASVKAREFRMAAIDLTPDRVPE